MYVPISDFAIVIKRSTFPVQVLSLLDICIRETILFDLKLAIELSLIIKWVPDGKICYWVIHTSEGNYFASYLTHMLTLGPH